MKNPIRMPLRSLNLKRKKEQVTDHKIKPSPSAPVNITSTPSLTQSSSYNSCTSSVASSTQTRKSAEPPGWVHNPPPRTVNQDNISSNNLQKENNVPPMRNSSYQYTPSNTPHHRQWSQHTTVPSPVRIRSLQQVESENMQLFQRQNPTHMMSENTIQMTYSDSSGSDGSSISSVSGDNLGPIMGLDAEESSDEQLDFYRNERCANHHSRSVEVEESQVSFPQTSTTMDSAIVVHSTQENGESDFRNALLSASSTEASGDANNDTTCSPERGEGEISSPAVSTGILDMSRMQDIYASMMVAFRKKIMAELREEMQKEVQHQLSALQTELSEMNTRLMNLEKNQSTQQQELQHSSSTIETSILKNINSKLLYDSDQQQRRLEAMLDAKLAKVSVEMNLAVNEVKKEGERLSKMIVRTESPPRNKECSSITSQNCISTKDKEEGLRCENARINASFAEAMLSIDKCVDDCDNLANDFDTIAYRMSRDGDSDDESF